MRKIWVAFLVLALIASFGAGITASAADSYHSMSAVSVDTILASGFSQPLGIVHAGDQSGRLFVMEQGGKVWVIRPGEGKLAQPFLDISALIKSGGEQGLLGLAFHPNYESNGFFYINYTRLSDGATVIARYSVSNTPNEADPLSAKILLTVPQPAANHNGGHIAFGPDGFLYIALGDGGGSGDPNNNAQNRQSLLGKILRLDVDHGNPYAIPATNPFAERGGAGEVWAYGLRNPWRFSFDALTGDLWIADVGQNMVEEINFQRSGSAGGQNYGWRCREGSQAYNTEPPCNDPVLLATFTSPIAEYTHMQGGQSITGGFVYRGSAYPSWQGRYFFGDFISGRIWSMSRQETGSGWNPPTQSADTNLNISSFGEGEDGQLYVVDYSRGTIRILEPLTLPISRTLPLISK